MSHSSGVSGLDQPAVVKDLYDWQKATSRMAQAPWWQPGTASGYHALNYGHLVGELVQRVVGYFNATRELAGMRRYLDDDVTTRVRRHGKVRGMSDRIGSGTGMLEIEELTSRISSADISSVLKRLEVGFAEDLDTSARRKSIREEYAAARKDKRDPHPLVDRFYKRGESGGLPLDVVLATSMLQVGVDVSRFGMMVVTGQPKNTAEYIQASSRVGRSAEKQGLVVTVYNWSRPRDLAHYEDFEHYHAAYYRQVEALSVTPYTRRALDRGTAATFVAAVRNAIEPYSRDADAQDVDLDGEVVGQATARLLSRAERASDHRGREYLSERIGALRDRWTDSKTGSTRLRYRKRGGKEPLNGLLAEAGGGAWTELTVPMSMRETENEVNLLVPGKGLFDPVLGQPAWSFAAPAEVRARLRQRAPGRLPVPRVRRRLPRVPVRLALVGALAEWAGRELVGFSWSELIAQ